MTLTNDSAGTLVFIALFLLLAAVTLVIAGAMTMAADEEKRAQEYSPDGEHDSSEHDD